MSDNFIPLVTFPAPNDFNETAEIGPCVADPEEVWNEARRRIRQLTSKLALIA